MSAEVIPFPEKPKPPKPKDPQVPVTTTIIAGDQQVQLNLPLPYPSADAVDPRYLEALKKQRDGN